mmetsp:Transcript_13437/g.43542  ORF Transcript_13437/g.43542 Transcript_13437/m.43542 type:complete len:216 (-) Transcript_13437:785-1432(-)
MGKNNLPHVNIHAVMTTAENMLMTKPVANTMAFGAVATGSMKAQLAANVAGTMSNAAGTPIETDICPMMGNNTLAVAVLLVISVRKVTNSTTRNTKKRGGRIAKTVNCSPTHSERPVVSNAVERAKPPPKRKTSCQGVFSNVSQSNKRFLCPSLNLAGIKNKAIVTALEMVSSSKVPFGKSNASTTYFLETQPAAVTTNSSPTRTSAWVRSPSSR